MKVNTSKLQPHRSYQLHQSTSSACPAQLLIVPRSPPLQASLTADGPALLGEHCKLQLKIENRPVNDEHIMNHIVSPISHLEGCVDGSVIDTLHVSALRVRFALSARVIPTTAASSDSALPVQGGFIF